MKTCAKNLKARRIPVFPVLTSRFLSLGWVILKKYLFSVLIVVVLMVWATAQAKAVCLDTDELHKFCYGSNPSYSEWFNTPSYSYSVMQSDPLYIKIYIKNNGNFDLTFRGYALDCDAQGQNCGAIWNNEKVMEENATPQQGGFEGSFILKTTHATQIGQRKLTLGLDVWRKGDNNINTGLLYATEQRNIPLEITKPTTDQDCDGFDDDGNGLIDDGEGSPCLVKLLFVPMCYKGTDADFTQDVENFKTLFYDSMKMTACKDKVVATTVPVAKINLACPKNFTDKNDPLCQGNDGWYNELKTKAAANNINLGDYNEIVYLTDQDICGSRAGETGGGGWWAQSSDPAISMHEMGHGYGFDEEYCSVQAGGADYGCNSEESINYLGADLGCDPNENKGCCSSCKNPNGTPGYFSCCSGNQTPNGGRCIMTTAQGQREFCNRCVSALTDPSDPKTKWNPNGNLPLACQWSNPTGPKKNFLMTFSTTENGGLKIHSLDTLFGRPGLGGSHTTGLYKIEIIKDGSVIYETNFNFHPNQVSGLESSTAEIYYKGMKFVVPDDVNETDVLKVKLYKDGVLTGQETVNAPDLTVKKTVDKADALPGDTLTYTVTVTNIGSDPATSVQLVDTFPDGTTDTRSLSDIPGGESRTETFTYVVPFPIIDKTILTNKVKVTGTDTNGHPDADETNNADEASTTIHIPVLTLTKTASLSVNAGEAITYTITYENTGSAGAENVVITDTLPANVYYSIALDSGAGPKPATITTNANGTTTLRWTFSTLAASSGPQTITFTARPGLLFLGGEAITNSAVLDFSDTNGNDYPLLTASAATTMTILAPNRTPRTLGFYRNHPEVWSGEILAMIQATDSRFDGADGSIPDGILSAKEVAKVFAPAGNMPQILKAQLLATYFNLAARQINAGTAISSMTSKRLGLTTVRSAVIYAADTLKLLLTKKTQPRYSDATVVLDETNNGKSEKY